MRSEVRSVGRQGGEEGDSGSLSTPGMAMGMLASRGVLRLREGSSGFERGPSEVGFIVSHKFAEANLPPAKDLNRGPCKRSPWIAAIRNPI